MPPPPLSIRLYFYVLTTFHSPSVTIRYSISFYLFFLSMFIPYTFCLFFEFSFSILPPPPALCSHCVFLTHFPFTIFQSILPSISCFLLLIIHLSTLRLLSSFLTTTFSLYYYRNNSALCSTSKQKLHRREAIVCCQIIHERTDRKAKSIRRGVKTLNWRFDDVKCYKSIYRWK